MFSEGAEEDNEKREAERPGLIGFAAMY